MSLFNQILSAIGNPEQEASTSQLGSILDTVQQLSVSDSNSAQSPAIESAMSIVGNYTRSALQAKRNQGGAAQVQQLINQFAGNGANASAVNSLFNNAQVGAMIDQISSRTGLNSQTIKSLLPVLVPIVLNMLKTGNKPSNATAGNSVLNSFLDSDGDGDVDVADAMRMAARYLGR